MLFYCKKEPSQLLVMVSLLLINSRWLPKQNASSTVVVSWTPILFNGGSRGGAGGHPPPPTPLFLDQTEARMAKKIFWETSPRPHPYLRVWMTGPPLSHGLDPALLLYLAQSILSEVAIKRIIAIAQLLKPRDCDFKLNCSWNWYLVDVSTWLGTEAL